MKTLTRRLFQLAVLFIFTGSTLMAQDFKYIGANKCKICHNKPATGQQYKIWSEGPHAKALASLSNAESMEYAKKNGIADPAKDAKCLSCHSTAASVPESLHAGITVEEGVSCESCHGPGSAYKAVPVMKDQEYAMEKGLILPTEEVCKKCHNEKNPFHKPFNFKEYAAKIAHDNPQTD